MANYDALPAVHIKPLSVRLILASLLPFS